jgi:trigger factor
MLVRMNQHSLCSLRGGDRLPALPRSSHCEGTKENPLKVVKDKIGPGQFVLNVEVEPERLQQPLRRAAQRLTKRRPMAGFRPGKAPYDLVERTYGKELIVDEMMAEIGNDLYREALDQAEVEPYARAEFEITQIEPLTLKVTVPAEPKVILGDYATISVSKETITVAEEEIEHVLSQLQEEQALWVPVERGAQMGDQVQIDALGTTDDEQRIEQNDLTLELSDQVTPEGFGENLVGAASGETKEFDIEYPIDFRDKDLAGKTVHFQVTIQAVKEKELPDLDDGLAQSLGEHESLADLRDDVRHKLLERKEAEASEAALEEALNALVEQATIEYPPIALEHEIDIMQQNLVERLEQRGFTLEGYLRTTGKTLAQWRLESRPQAELRLKRALVLAEFAKAEDVKVSKEDLAEEVNRVSSQFGDQADSVRKALATQDSALAMTNDVYRRKALTRLLSLATGEEVPDSTAPSDEQGPAASASTETDNSDKLAAEQDGS